MSSNTEGAKQPGQGKETSQENGIPNAEPSALACLGTSVCLKGATCGQGGKRLKPRSECV